MIKIQQPPHKIIKEKKMIAEKRELGMEPEMPEMCQIWSVP
jgi:hypothetical protein